jgi:uncharacterized protein YndB with AHSA1/START domain
MAEAVFLVDIDAGKTTIVEALTSQTGIRGWWTPDANVTDDALDLGFPDAPARFALSVDEVAEDVVRWTSQGDFPPHWVGTEVAWQIMDHPGGAGSQVFFSHAGFAAADPMLGHTAFTWAMLLRQLKTYAESGEAGTFFSS